VFVKTKCFCIFLDFNLSLLQKNLTFADIFYIIQRFFYMKTIFSTFFLVFFLFTLQAQSKFWTQTDEAKISRLEKLDRDTKILKQQVFALDFNALKSLLDTAVNRELGVESELIVEFPNANGELQRYRIYQASVLHEELSAKHPDIKSYIGVGLDDRTATIRFSTTIFGFHGMILSGKTQTTYIDPYTKDLNYYTVYFKNNIEKPNNNFKCLVSSDNNEPSGTHFSPFNTQETQLNGSLRKFRLALACTIEYAAFHVNAAGLGSGSISQKKAAVLAAMNVTVTRINAVYERDLSVTLQLVPNNESIIFITSDNFNNYNPDVLIDQSKTVINSNIGINNYDIGHTVSTGGGGLAQLGSVCKASEKAYGITGSPSPVGDPFDIDYVSHEMGHQFGANHTFNNSCGGNKNSSTAAETGSGSTIMAYAGICSPNVQNNSSDYFHAVSLQEIKNYLLFQASCAQKINNGNTKPTIANIPNKTIPKGTAFVLRGNGYDADGDALTYCWEQIDVQNSTQPPSKNSTTGPNFRSLSPSVSPDRYMPSLASVLAGNITPIWEVVPNVARSMRFALTVRDNNPNGGEFERKDMIVNVSGVAGPFVVTSQNTNNISWQANSQQTITWNVAGTTNAPINASNVNILLSTNGGTSFNYVLASNTPNDGTETITVPNISTSNARIMVEAVGNIFYAVNSHPFTIVSCFTYSNNTSVGIPDGVGANIPGQELVSTINVTDVFSLEKVKVMVNINHSYVQNLRIVLEHPNGNPVVLWNRNCDGQNGINVTFDQDFPVISCTGSTISGVYRPVGNLSNLNGLATQGEWKLKITDYYNGDTGSLISWSLDFGCDTSSVNDFSLSNFTLYPNPNNGNFSVEFNSKNSEDINISVFDLRGRKVFGQNYQNNGKFYKNIELKDVQAGIYLVVIKDGEYSQVKKIAIK